MADAAAATNDHHDLAGYQQPFPVPLDLLLDLAPLERPVLELEDILVGNEPEAIDRLGPLPCLQARGGSTGTVGLPSRPRADLDGLVGGCDRSGVLLQSVACPGPVGLPASG